MPAHGSLRASDSDRDRIVERLRHAASEGRLAAHELDDRVHAALTAVTYSDLAATVHDLPSARDPATRRPRPAPRPSPRPERRPHSVGGFALAALRANPLLIVFLIPLVAVTGAMVIAASAVWGVFAVILLALGARAHGRSQLQGGPWNLMWDRRDRY